MPQMTANVAASRTRSVATPPVDQPAVAAPASSKLNGRAELGTNPGRRVGFLGKIASFLGRCFRRASAAREVGVPRIAVTRKQQEANFTRKLYDISDTLTSGKATSQTMLHALLAAEDAGMELGSPQSVLEPIFQTLCEQASTTRLNQLALAFNSRELTEAADQLTEHPAAAQALVVLQRALNHELSRRAEANVAAEIAAAVRVMESGGPAERVTEHLRLAFAAAMPLVNRWIVAPRAPTDRLSPSSDLDQTDEFDQRMREWILDRNPAAPQSIFDPNDQAARQSILDPNDRAVRELILDQLESQPAQTRGAALAHLSHEHLAALKEDVEQSGRPLEQEINAEIQQRPARMCTDLQRSAADFIRKCNSRTPVDRQAFLTELAEITRAVRAIETHQKSFATQAPAELAELKQSVATALDGAFSSKKLRLGAMPAPEIAGICRAFEHLDARQTGEKLLANDLDDVVEQCEKECQQSLERLVFLLPGKEPEKLLTELSHFAKSWKALKDIAATFVPPSSRMDARKIMNRVAGQLWPEPRNPLKMWDETEDVLHTTYRSLRPALEHLAHHVDDNELANQLQAMVTALDVVAGRLTATGKFPIGLWVWGVAPLPESMRQALGRWYGIDLTAESKKRNAGHCNARQTQAAAALIERPAGSTSQQMTKLGGHEVSSKFVEDQMHGKPVIRVETHSGTQPLSDLITFCGGNVEEARTLSLYLQHEEIAGLTSTLTVDSPLQLDDGTVGTVVLNQHASGGSSSEVTLSRGPNGRPQLEVTLRYDDRNLFKPADGGEPLYLTADSSVTLRYRAELVDGALKLLAPPSYHFILKKDDFQRPYARPTAAAIRRMRKGDAALAEVLEHSTRIGKDNEVKALRAVDAFQREPTLLNAVEVISECERDPATAAFVPQRVRDAVKDALQKARTGAQSEFHANLFVGLAEKLAQRFDAEVSTVLSDAMPRGES